MNDLFVYVLLPLVALLLGIAAVGGLTVATGLALRWQHRAFALLLGAISLASIGTIVLSGRRLQLGDGGLENIGQSDVAAGMAGKLMLVFVIGGALAMCAARLLDFNRSLIARSRFHQFGKAHPTDIAMAFMCFYVAYSILPIFFGVQHYFHVKLIYPFFIYMAIFLWLPLHRQDPATACKVSMGLVVFASLLLAVVRPDAAIQPGYGGLIPGFNIRLWGATSHANSLGAVTCGYILFEMAEPVRRRWLHFALLGGAFICLILSQSKTSMLGVIAGASIIYGTRAWHLFNRRGRSYDGKAGELLALLFGIACIVVAVLAAWVMFGDGNIVRSVEHRLDSNAINSLSSGSGRTYIWAAAIDAGMQNPLFGQGADYWNRATRLRLGLSGAITAHNQYLQAFSLAGLVGLATLLVFLGYLTVYAFRGARASSGATLAMLLVLLMRSITETPIVPNSVLAAEFIGTMAIIIYIIDRGARPLAARRRDAAAVAQSSAMPVVATR